MKRKRLLFGKLNKRDDRGSAIVIVIIAMALIGIMATTILWAAYLNYRIKINDLKVKNSFYSAETVVEQIQAGVKLKVSEAINEAYLEVVSNWDALGTESNRESYFVTAYIAAVEKKFGVKPEDPNHYNKDILKGFVDSEWWFVEDPNNDGYIVNVNDWEDGAEAEFKAANAVNGYGSMSLKNICIEYYDTNGYLSIINTDIAIDVPKLRFTQAGNIDRLYPYVLIGDEGIVIGNDTLEAKVNVTVNGSIYGGVDDKKDGGIQITRNSHVVIEDASYVISGGDIVVGNYPNFTSMINQDAGLIIRNVMQDSKGFRTNVYANGLVLNGSHLDITGRMYIANDLILSGKGSNVSLTGQYYGYGDTNLSKKQELVNKTDEDGNVVQESQNVNPANTSSAIVINGKDSTVDLTGLTMLQLTGRAYVSLSEDDEKDNGMPHVLTGESISVKSNQIAYLVPAECVGTQGGKSVIGQNPVSTTTWMEMLSSLYQDQTTETTDPAEAADTDDADDAVDKEFKIVDANRQVTKLGGATLDEFDIPTIKASDLTKEDFKDITTLITALNRKAVTNDAGVRFLYKSDKEQVYLYLVMNQENAAKYFAQYYNVNSNKASLDSYFNQYVSGGIRLKGNVQGYTVVGNSMVSVTDAGSGDSIMTSPEGENLVRLLSSVTPGEDDEGKEGDQNLPTGEPGDYQEVSDNVEKTDVDINDLKSRNEIINSYENLTANLLEDDPGTEENVFENLVKLDSTEGVIGLEEYLSNHSNKVEFKTDNNLKAVLVNSEALGSAYKVSDPKLRLVIAIGDVEVTDNFQGLIIASGKITVSDKATIKKDGEGVYAVLQAMSTIAEDTNVPANFLYNGSGMIKNGYEDADMDESGNINIDYSEIVRYENWIKK